ncbi:hypothetical protein [Nitriliruptor alkaliphilus]|uniref:hypothetical protein n=1 Tax=Nitriliruptor alkaliphilus TaxID=427918 RepID=UPI000698F562|nr:hypothetical protein [Nitriliruptor alkaliphilus]
MADRPRIELKPRATPELTAAIEEIVTEFEQEHEANVMQGGPGWVPRLRRSDIVIASVVNLALVLWLVIAFVGGGANA